MRQPTFVSILAVALSASAPAAAQGYIGPGLGLGAIAVALGVVGSIFLMLFAVIWYPVKKLIRKIKGSSAAAESVPAKEQNDSGGLEA